MIELAWEMARDDGLTGISLRAIATRLGLAQPSLFHYFASKNALYDALFADAYDELQGRFRSVIETTADPVDAVHAASAAVFDFFVEEPARFHLLWARAVPGFAPSAAARRPAVELWVLARVALRQAGAEGSGAVDLWAAVVSGMVTQQIANDPGGDRWRRLLPRAIDLFLRA